MKILYIGENKGTSKHRADALVRLGYSVDVLNLDLLISKSKIIYRWQWLTGGLFIENYIRKKITESLRGKYYDLIIVNQGETISCHLIESLRNFAKRIINYVNDDPFGNRDENRWKYFKNAVPYYDLLVVVRACNVSEAYALGAKKVIRVFMSADEVAHAPQKLSAEDIEKWTSDVLFVGTWMPERGPFMAKLIEAGIPLSIYGGRWNKAKEWNLIQKNWKGNGLYGDDYVKAIQAAKVCLGLLSKGNRDLHTQRSMEIPYIGGLLCAERTPEHLKLYKENEEAVFWDDVEECIERCSIYLSNPDLNKKIKKNAKLASQRNNNLNESVLKTILEAAFENQL